MRDFREINEIIRLKSRKFYIERTLNIRKKSLSICDFSIISNNCWGGLIYQSYGLPYKTPTIGLFIMPEDYLILIKNLHGYLTRSISFINPKNSKYYEELSHLSSFGKYPIGKLNDIEIHFLHYKSEEEAREKWNKRCSRINYEKVIYKFNDQNGCTREQASEFLELSLENKIFFSSKWNIKSDSCFFIKHGGDNGISASREPFGKSTKFNVTRYLNDL